MREVKYRFWMGNYATPKYEYWENLVKLGDDVIGGYLTSKRSEIIKEQFTGLKDKNGVEIYEGDKLSIKDEVGKRGEVTVGFESGGFIIFKGLAWRYIGQYDIEINDIEVIGNIHEG